VTPLFRRLLADLAVAAVLVAGAVAIFSLRKGAVQAFFVDARTRAPAPELARPVDDALLGAGLAPVSRVRVVLLDGVGLDTAHTLPAYQRLCERGHDLVVDVGFPTVSLPVQHALWTGLTQQQSGILYRPRLLDPPPLAGIPAQVAGSVAVAEYHPYIVHSLGFTTTLPPDPAAEPEGWREAGFLAAARDAVTGPAPLVFVHVLRVDSAGHRHGAASAAYGQAAVEADRILDELVTTAGDDIRWFLLSDHGHRAGGGHAGAEPSIRRVRACIAGALLPAAPVEPGAYLHLVDYSRAIADSVGAALPATSAGRPLYEALAAPVQPEATIPAPGTGRWAAALAILAAALALTAWAARGSWLLLPWWWPLAYAAVLVIEGTPSLSTPMIYKPLGRAMYVAALPGLGVLAVTAALALRQHRAWRVAVAALALPAAAALAALILCGGLHVLLGVAGDPPLMPRWTAHTSLFAVLSLTAMLVVALAVLASCARLASDRGGPAETGRSAASARAPLR
jgi:hypothetical protein